MFHHEFDWSGTQGMQPNGLDAAYFLVAVTDVEKYEYLAWQ